MMTAIRASWSVSYPICVRKNSKNPKLREALRYAFNFDSLNKSNFYSQYVQPDSYFFGSLLASEGLPEGKELEILKSLKNPVPEEVFTKEFKNISNANRKDERANRAHGTCVC